MGGCLQGDHGDDDLTAALRELSERRRPVPLVVFGARCGRPSLVQQMHVALFALEWEWSQPVITQSMQVETVSGAVGRDAALRADLHPALHAVLTCRLIWQSEVTAAAQFHVAVGSWACA